MLSIVVFSSGGRRFFCRRKKRAITAAKTDIPAAEPVFVIKAGEKADPQRLRSVIKRYGKALFAGGRVPDGMEDLCFHASALPLKMLVKTAADFYSLQPKSRRSIVLSVFDDRAAACNEVSELCRYVRRVRVVTSKTAAYEECARGVFESCGACLMVSVSRYTAQKSDLIISLDDRALDGIDFKKAVVYRKMTDLPDVLELNRSFAGYDDDRFADFISDRFTLLCALYEECGYKIRKIPVFSCHDAFKELTKDLTF